MRTLISTRVPAALFAAGAAAAALTGPTTAADPAPRPADPAASCAALGKVQPAIDDLRDKANAYLANPGQAGAEEPTSAPAATTTSPTASAPTATTSAPAAGSKLHNVVDSLHHISGELKGAEPAVADTPLRDSADKLATTVNEAAESVSDIAASKANSANPLKLGGLGVSITSAVIVYQANYNRVCGQTPAGEQTQPTTAPPAPAGAGAAKPSAPPQSPAASKKPD